MGPPNLVTLRVGDGDDLAPLVVAPEQLELEPDAEGDVGQVRRLAAQQPGPADAPALVLQAQEAPQHPDPQAWPQDQEGEDPQDRPPRHLQDQHVLLGLVVTELVSQGWQENCHLTSCVYEKV